MTNLMQVNRNWATRPDDERFVSLTQMQEHFHLQRDYSRQLNISNRQITFEPSSDAGDATILATGPKDDTYAPTHWSFGQSSARAEAPAGYLRTLPAALAADCINFGLWHK